ncbi:MliC family protein [Gilvimarinus polysaccharolyticus]|uniref:MliC family protein n=1 Tax=Gilvimarinus polysaccharolyticus TaxID=863921 RepID=UPI0006731704|nr:MliC family protein [Gilvimarinus polysaccharolyticus]
MQVAIAPLTFTVFLLLSACVRYQPSTATTTVHHYRCNSDETITATYVTHDSAVIQYKNIQYDMKIAVSGSGSRYVNSEFVWWTKGLGRGSEGTLFLPIVNGASGPMIELCRHS